MGLRCTLLGCCHVLDWNVMSAIPYRCTRCGHATHDMQEVFVCDDRAVHVVAWVMSVCTVACLSYLGTWLYFSTLGAWRWPL